MFIQEIVERIFQDIINRVVLLCVCVCVVGVGRVVCFLFCFGDKALLCVA